MEKCFLTNDKTIVRFKDFYKKKDLAIFKLQGLFKVKQICFFTWF